jgi:hypothetical protein
MIEQEKTVKQYCKEAKKRLKQGFWQRDYEQLNDEIAKAEQVGISASKVKEFYTQKVSVDIKSRDDDSEAFYLKVKKILDEEGEISNAIGRLTDKTYYASLSYDEQQRYNLELSEKYLKAVERYKKEKSVLVSV